MKLQQYSGPVMAKGLEDTAFYRYNRFLALNEVGGNPDRLGLTLPAFHCANALRAGHWPHTMLATSTHDTKHGEDSRARLAVLADIPDEWGRQAVALESGAAGGAPRRRGHQPPRSRRRIRLLSAAGRQLAGRADRPRRAQPRHSRSVFRASRSGDEKVAAGSQAAHDVGDARRGIRAGVLAFVEAALDPSRSSAFLTLFRPFAERVARLGIGNSLVQTALKLTLPGMPDFYQGSELWDLNLVDPDNRRPVDYPLREKALTEVTDALARDRCGTMRRLAAAWPDGRIKLAVIATLLEYRRGHPDLFADGSYEPVMVEGDQGDRLCCFLRQRDDAAVLVAASRFPGASEGAEAPADETVPIPACFQRAQLRELLTGRAVFVENGGVAARQLFADLPVAVLVPA